MTYKPETKTVDVLIYDVIGGFWGEGFEAKPLAEALASFENVDRIDVRINSPGGDVYDGMAIYNALKNHPARVVVYIDGAACSAASFIAMAGDEIHAHEATVFMIHCAWTILAGNADDLQKEAGFLAKMDEQIAKIYAARTGLSEEDVRLSMRAETWYTAKEAMVAGFVTSVIPNKSKEPTATVAAKNLPFRVPERFAHLFIERNIVSETPETPVNATPEPVVEATPEPVVNDAPDLAAAAKSRAVLIANACAKFGATDEVAALIASDMDVLQVQQYLQNAAAANMKPVGEQTPEKPADPDAKFKAEYAANSKTYARMGLSEDDYIASRRLDGDA